VPEGAEHAQARREVDDRVYGSSPRDPALFTESVEPRALPKSGYAKDAVEVEGYVRGFGRRRPDVTLSLLRFTNFIGPSIETPLTRYFSLPVVPTVFGFDPRIQLCHEDDGIEVLARSVREEHPGIFNVGGSGVLLLSQAIRKLGKAVAAVRRPRCRWWRGPSAAPGWSTSRPSRCATSSTAASPT
jgi:UDP-glucose 4-epimerase